MWKFLCKSFSRTQLRMGVCTPLGGQLWVSAHLALPISCVSKAFLCLFFLIFDCHLPELMLQGIMLNNNGHGDDLDPDEV